MSQVLTLSGLPGDWAEFEPSPTQEAAPGRERRSGDPIDVLSRRLDHVCVTAVDALQIAAALEADGLSDARCEELYGLPDVFAVAEELHRRVPLRAAAADAHLGHHADRSPLRIVARGALFALPALAFIGMRGVVDSRAATVVLIGVTIVGWGVSQAMSILAHLVAGRSGLPAGRRLLWAALVTSTGVLAAAACAAALLGARPLLVAAAAGQLLYLVAATVLIFFDADLVLAAALAPGAVAGLIVAVAGSGALPSAGAASVAMSVLLTLAAATREVWPRRGHGAGARPSANELAQAGVFLGYGVLAGTLVAMPAVAVLSDPARAGVFVAASMLPLALSMGVAELELRRYRASTRSLLMREGDLARFGRGAWRRLLEAAAVYGAALVSLILIAGVIAWAGGWMTGAVATTLAAEVALGVGLFIGLVLIAFGQVRRVLTVLAGLAALAAVSAASGLASPEQAPGFLVTCALFLGALLVVASIELRKVVNHR